MRIIDAWMQHPTRRFLEQPFFESLRRWTRQGSIQDVPLSLTIETMDKAGVEVGLVSAWWGPRGALIDNDEVASFVRAHPSRLVGVASVDLARPVEAVRELRRCVRELDFRGLRIVPWLSATRQCRRSCRATHGGSSSSMNPVEKMPHRTQPSVTASSDRTIPGLTKCRTDSHMSR